MRETGDGPDRPSGVVQLCTRHYGVLAAAVLCLAAFNLTYRLDAEAVTQWDEALYANSAWEMRTSGDWVVTTLFGAVDYYNTKPPLNVWLIALAFEWFGVGLVTLRLASVAAAWLTVALLMAWARHLFGPVVSLFSGVVLATCLGFVHIHAGRSANPDSLFALLVLLTVVALWAVDKQPWHRVWLGPLLAAAFLLKGMAVLMPVAIVVLVELRRRRFRATLSGAAASLAATILLVAPVVAWGAARWQFDGWQFLRRVVIDDFLGHTLTTLDGHANTPLYYLNLLQQNHYDWLVACLVAWFVTPRAWTHLRGALSRQDNRSPAALLGCWAAATLLIPTVMQTRLPWYLNAFYPVFALGVGALLAHGFSSLGRVNRKRLFALSAATALALAVAESKLLWYSYQHRDLTPSLQGLLLLEREHLSGNRVFRRDWQDPEIFVVSALVGANRQTALDPDDFLRRSVPGDYFVWSDLRPVPGLTKVRSNGSEAIYVRRD